MSGRWIGACGTLALLWAGVLAGCVEQPVEVVSHSSARAAPPVPPAIAELVEAWRAGKEIPLQALLDVTAPGHGVPAGRASAAIAADPVLAVLDLFAAVGREVPPDALADIARLATLDVELAEAVATIIGGSADAVRLAQRAWEGDAVDWRLAYQAERVQLAAVEAALPTLRSFSGGLLDAPRIDVCEVLALDLESKAQTYTCNYTLTLDLGGNDIYQNAAGGNFYLDTASLAVDVAGDDDYIVRFPDHVGVTGGGFFGAGALIDAGGDDLYDVTVGEGSASNGAGDSAGIGYLADLGGSDTIRSEAGLHSALNGGSWIGAGHMLLVGGTDTVEGVADSASGINGGGWVTPAALVGLGGDRTYTVRDSGRVEGTAANGGGWGGGDGLLFDYGGSTTYEAYGGNDTSTNGAANGGRGFLMDLGGGHDTYLARLGERSGTNGANRGGDGALLYDDGGVDTYDDDASEAPAIDETVNPKGERGAQIDDARSVEPSGRLRWSDLVGTWPAAAQPVATSLETAARGGHALRDVHGITLSFAGRFLPGPEEPAPLSLTEAITKFSLAHGHVAAPTDLVLAAGLPPDLQAALADLLMISLAADRAVPDRADFEAGDPDASGLALRAQVLDAVDRVRPVLQRYAGQSLAPIAIGACDSYLFDFTGAAATYTCDPYLQVSLGGDSTYRNRGGGTEGGLRILIDAAGHDRYLGPESAQNGSYRGLNGAAYGGMAVLADFAGNDVFRPLCGDGCSANGGGDHGYGALVDYAGDDDYGLNGTVANASTVNGAGTIGYGFLADYAGKDTYDVVAPLHSSINGAAFLGGSGLLFDGAGDDLYRGIAGEHGVVNAAATSGASMIWDVSGSDRYWGESGHHGQTNGAGFFSVPGSWIIDERGSDAYTGVSPMKPSTNGNYYIVGKCLLPVGCAHGMSALVDLSGIDAYVEWETMPGMEGHDAHAGHGEAEPMPPMAPMPSPIYDRTIAPKGDLGAQLDLSASLS